MNKTSQLFMTNMMNRRYLGTLAGALPLATVLPVQAGLLGTAMEIMDTQASMGTALATGFGNAGARMLEQVMHQGIHNWMRLQTPQATMSTEAQFLLGDAAEPGVAVRLYKAALFASAAKHLSIVILCRTLSESQDTAWARQVVECIAEAVDLLLVLPTCDIKSSVIWEGLAAPFSPDCSPSVALNELGKFDAHTDSIFVSDGYGVTPKEAVFQAVNQFSLLRPNLANASGLIAAYSIGSDQIILKAMYEAHGWLREQTKPSTQLAVSIRQNTAACTGVRVHLVVLCKNS